MVVLMSEQVNGHKRVCNERCHYAVKPKCDCICGGKNHQLGLRFAAQAEPNGNKKDEVKHESKAKFKAVKK